MPVNPLVVTLLLNAMVDVQECAETTCLDAELRCAWISNRIAEAINAAKGEYASAAVFQQQREALAELMSQYFIAQSIKKPPHIIGETTGVQ